MVLGTGSHVGKSLLTAAFCRIFSRAGLRVSPFKAQNMSLNSAATPEGLEIGRAQALQAEAAGVPASVHMNPVLLKPSSDTSSQVIVRGKIFAQFSAEDYFRRRSDELLPTVLESYETLAAHNDLMIIEGAGSPAEINLKDRDIVNLRMAQLADARCVLVGDIDRGGVFASLYGTIALLDPAERDLIEGFIINKFRGDIRILLPGIARLEERMGKPCLGVIPYIPNLHIDEEDSVAMEVGRRAQWHVDDSPRRPLRIAVLQLPFLSNFTDFDPLKAEPTVNLRFCSWPDELREADVVILPGTKQTVEDLRWMGAVGLDHAIAQHAERRIVIGICGGMQMLGVAIEDPLAIESAGTEPGLGLLPIRTKMNREKTTRGATGQLLADTLFGSSMQSLHVGGYEIHIGETQYLEGSVPLARICRLGDTGSVVDGCVSASGRVIGTYLHGIFHEDRFRHSFLQAARAACHLEPAAELVDWKRLRQAEFDRLAKTVGDSVDLRRLLGFVGLPWPAEESLCTRAH